MSISLESPSSVRTLKYRDAGRYVHDIGARIVRSISSFGGMDAVFTSDLFPGLFYTDAGVATPPQMLWQLDTGEWVGIEEVQVGYLGTGPGLAGEALSLDPPMRVAGSSRA